MTQGVKVNKVRQMVKAITFFLSTYDSGDISR